MKSTGEVMGLDTTFGLAYAKSQLAAGQMLPPDGTVFISVRDRDKKKAAEAAASFANLGFTLVATKGTAAYFREQGLEVETVNKVFEGRPNIIDMINTIWNTGMGLLGV